MFDKFEIDEVKLTNGSNTKSNRSMTKLFLIFIILSVSLFLINDLVIFYFFNKSDKNLEPNENNSKMNKTIEEIIPLKIKKLVDEQEAVWNEKIDNQKLELNEFKSELNKLDEKIIKNSQKLANELNSDLMKMKLDLTRTKNDQEKKNKVIEDEKLKLDNQMKGMKDQIDKLLKTNRELEQKVTNMDLSDSKSRLIFKFDNISTLLKGNLEYVRTNSSYYRGLFWHPGLELKKENNIAKWMGIHLYANDNPDFNYNWSFEVDYEVELLNQSGKPNKLTKSHNIFKRKNNVFTGDISFIEIDDLAKDGFIKDDQLILKLIFKRGELKIEN